MILSDKPEALKHFRKTPWKFQQTFKTPLKNLANFVATILSGCSGLRGASITIDAVVFEPKHLIDLLNSHPIAARYTKGVTLTADNPEEVPSMLEAALGDSIDFIFLPTPKPFAIYADHDEYATFYSHSRSGLNCVTQPLVATGFTAVPNYHRRL